MDQNIKRAVKGDSTAMGALYDAHKTKVKSLCQTLLANETDGDKAVAHVFKSVFEELVAGNINSAAEFEKLAVRKAIAYCKTKALKKNNRTERTADNLPVFQRFIYVAHIAAGYSPLEIARVLNTTPKNVEKELEAKPANMDIVYAASTEVSKATDTKVKATIDTICAPIQKKAKRKRVSIISMLVAVLVVAAIIVGVSVGKTEDKEGTESTAETDATLNYDTTHYADIEIENYGTITVALDGNSAPETVANFVALAEEGFYNGLTFHRIIEGFMMQGGDPEGTDYGGSDTTITGEFTANGVENNLSHYRGAISMARSNDYNSASSQFFIVHEDSRSSLDGLYACFGYVEAGMDVVDAVCADAQPTDSNGTIAAEEQPVITSITIREVADDTTESDSETESNS